MSSSTNKTATFTVELSHNQLSFVNLLLVNYENVWAGRDQLPAHVQDLLTSTKHQLLTCKKNSLPSE